MDEDYDEYEDEDEDDEDEDDEPTARSRRAGPAAMSLSFRNSNPISAAFARLGKSKAGLRKNPLKGGGGRSKPLASASPALLR